MISACDLSENHGNISVLERGDNIYKNYCQRCQGADPAIDNYLAPAIAYSTKELLQEKIWEASYPLGCSKKRNILYA